MSTNAFSSALIVESQRALAPIIRKVLSRAGIGRSEHVVDLYEAREHLSAGGFDLVLVDLHASPNSRPMLTEFLQMPLLERRPVFVLMVKETDKVQQNYVSSLPVDYVLRKPFLPDEFSARLREGRESFKSEEGLEPGESEDDFFLL